MWERPFDEDYEENGDVRGRLEYLEEMSPGKKLGDVLAGLDRRQFNGHDLVFLIRARQRQISMLQAEQYADMAELAHCPPSGPGFPPERQQEVEQFAPDEVRAALTWTRRAADSVMSLALRLVETLPEVWRALCEGRIDLPKARVLSEGTEHLDSETAREICDEILPSAPELTTGQIRHRLSRLCFDHDPDESTKRYAKGVEKRRVFGVPNPDGTADLIGANLPADRVAAVLDQINAIARSLRRRGDHRTMDQLRSDVFLDLLEGKHLGSVGHRRAVIDMRVDLRTLLGLADRAGEIPGWGPVIADIARQAVVQQPDGEWRVVVTDPDTGAVLWDGTTRRRPTAAQRRHVEARMTHCSFPGCRMPAHRCDHDHSIPVADGGPTEVSNDGPGCRHDHRLRHEGKWRFRQPRPGVYVWTSPHGHTYVTTRSPP